MPKENIAGPTVFWDELKDKNVKSNDGKSLGKITKISPNHFKVVKGRFSKQSFWVLKNQADAYDGKNLWLINNEEEIHDKFFYGEEPPDSTEGVDSAINADKINRVDRRMVGIPSKPSDSSSGYKNIRDTK